MGIRVHKLIGYGVQDLQFKQDTKRYTQEMTDPRINWEKLHEKMQEAYKVKGDIFLEWYRSNNPAITKLAEEEWHTDEAWSIELDLQLLEVAAKKNPAWSLSDCIFHDSEYGLPNVLVFVPVFHSDRWFRYDDTLDYMEETRKYAQKNRVEDLGPFGIYPFDAFMTRFRAPSPEVWEGKTIKCPKDSGFFLDKEGYLARMPNSSYSQFIGYWDPDIKALADGQKLEHLKNDWRAMLPTEVLCILWWLRDCFTDFNTFKNALRPLLYVYWS